MKRLNSAGSLLGIVLTTLLFVGLGVSLWVNRGLAFSPGAISGKSLAGVTLEDFSSHADFEKQCGKCHDPLRTSLATKCLECHTDVNEQIQNKQGAHSQIATVNACASCHPDHKGRNFDPTLASFQKFDHSQASFSLAWHQANYTATPMQCSECHTSTDFSKVDNQVCLACHAQHDSTFSQAHAQDFGSDCLGCHDGADKMKNFDHAQTGFALDGQHTQVTCTTCHNSSTVTDTPQECQDCHAEPTIHKGVFQQECDDCHSSQSWSPAKINDQPFEHFTTAGFSLVLHQADYSSQAISCATCHPASLDSYDLLTCIDCHSQHDPVFITDHQEQYGTACLNCHDGVDRLSNFQHANFFVLDGAHATLDCVDCHPNQAFRGTPSECSQCHKEPEIHAGVFGLKCFYCHSTDAWTPATLVQHVFPLNHGLADAATQSQCDTCHGATYVDYTCYNCHEHQEEQILQSHLEAGISEQQFNACATCHPDGSIQTGLPHQ